MYHTHLSEFIRNNGNWEQLLSDKPYCLKIKRDSGFVIFNYNQIDSDFNNPIVQEARGIIFKEGEWDFPVCHAFDKFGNYGESYVPEINFNRCWVTEKIDGSIIKVWFDFDSCHWKVSTNGMIDAYKAIYNQTLSKSFGSLFEQTVEQITDYSNVDSFMDSCVPDRNCTYIFELVSPETRVVIPYEENDIYYLGCRNNVSNTELPFFYGCFKLNTAGVKLPKIYLMASLADILKASQNLPWDKEGYVVVDDNCNRCKIKSPSYVLAHYGRNNGQVSKEALTDVILKNLEDDFLIYADDYKDILQDIKNKMIKYKNECVNSWLSLINQHFNSRKDFATEVQKMKKYVWGYCFKCYDEYVDINDYTKGWSASKWDKVLSSM